MILYEKDMPVDLLDLCKLLAGILVLILPGYLWSFLFSKTLTRIERVVFGFLLGVLFFSAAPYLLNVFFSVVLSADVILVCYFVYLVAGILLFFFLWYQSGKPRLQLPVFFTWRNLLLFCLLVFVVFMTFLPHLSMNYYLPFHVDEWVHWSFSRSIMDYGSVNFPDPYTGGYYIISSEIGFHVFTASISWFSTCSLLTLFLFLPSVFAVFLGLIAFCIGERAERKFGFEALLLIALIPTTTRYLGPSFYVAVAMGLLLMLYLVWIIQQKHLKFLFFIAPIIWCLALVHPATAFAGLLVVGIYAFMLVFEKHYKYAVYTGLNIVLTCLPFLILLMIPSRWKWGIDIFLNAMSGQQYGLSRSMIYVNFSELGMITWVFFIIGMYYVFIRRKSLLFTLCFSSIAFIVVIGLYSFLGYGVAILYERSFLYLFVFVPLVAAFGLREVREWITSLMTKFIQRKLPIFDTKIKHIIFPVVVVFLLLCTAVPAHLDTSYYKMVKEDEYASFLWIRENIDRYRDENNSYMTGAVHPYKASPFSAVTGLHIVTSSMHPLLRYELYDDMQSFLVDRARNTSFLIKYRISVVYGYCDNRNLTMIHPMVYLYPGLELR